MRTSSDDKCSKSSVTSTQKKQEGSNSSSGGGKLYIVGIGPGDIEQMSLKAYRLLQQVDVVVGYKTYIKLLDELLTEEQKVVSTGMTKEIDRCQRAIELANGGQEVAVVSSGDPGVYGMAGLVLELMTEQKAEFAVEIVPGVTAANAAAASLGAPLMHDYAVISLSDLLTPWQVIEKRLKAAAKADFIIALYNPKSKKRIEQIKIARDICLEHRSANTPVGIVRKAKRGNEEIIITTLDQMLDHKIDMLSTVIIGNSQSFSVEELMITPRGYQV